MEWNDVELMPLHPELLLWDETNPLDLVGIGVVMKRSLDLIKVCSRFHAPPYGIWECFIVNARQELNDSRGTWDASIPSSCFSFRWAARFTPIWFAFSSSSLVILHRRMTCWKCQVYREDGATGVWPQRRKDYLFLRSLLKEKFALSLKRNTLKCSMKKSIVYVGAKMGVPLLIRTQWLYLPHQQQYISPRVVFPGWEMRN